MPATKNLLPKTNTTTIKLQSNFICEYIVNISKILSIKSRSKVGTLINSFTVSTKDIHSPCKKQTTEGKQKLFEFLLSRYNHY